MHRVMLFGCLLLALGAAFSVAGFAIASRSAIPTATIDRRLILHPRTITAGTSLPGLGSAYLHMYPGIPGQQKVVLILPPSVHASGISVRARMVGMAMPPVWGTLTRQGGVYRGRLDLSMFGQYRLQVRLPTRASFALRIALSVPAL